MEERLSAAGGELEAVVRAGVATAILNRPSALNALTLKMVIGLARWLEAWAKDPQVKIVVLRGAGGKAFCAGGDVRGLRELHASNPDARDEFFAREYALDHRIHTYKKPVVALVDGIVMGGGMGISQGATLRVVGDRTRMAMPETSIGLFPDVGGSFFLSRTPGRLGRYLGLVGPTIRAADAIYCGLADAYLAPEAIDELDAGIEQAAATRDAGRALRVLAPATNEGGLPEGELEHLRAAIDRHFEPDSVEAIIASLAAEDDPAYRDWASRTREALSKKSPMLLKVTLEQLKRGAKLSLADCFRMELNLVHACFRQGDFMEGIRALLIDKDNKPQWNPPTLAQVTKASVDRFFVPRWSKAEHPLAHL
jgi:enoyl-CoA hydratase/carnithine racemase